MTGRRTIACRLGSGAVLPLLLPAALLGCGLADVEDARLEAGATDREIAVLRSAPANPRYSAVRVVERPYVGLEPVEEDRRGRLPKRFLEADAVTLPLGGIDRAGALARRIEAATGLEGR